jgi:hypothetical protein
VVGYGAGSVTQTPGLFIESERILAESADTVVAEIRLVNGDPEGGPLPPAGLGLRDLRSAGRAHRVLPQLTSGRG